MTRRDSTGYAGPTMACRGAVKMDVREATPDDAARLVALLRTLHAETEFMLYEPGEYADIRCT